MRTHLRSLAALALACGTIASSPARGEGRVDEPTPPAKPSETFIAGRPELARVYMELEHLVMERAKNMPVETLRRVNVGLDTAANGFFTGNYAAAIKGMSAQIAAIDPSRGGVGGAISVRLEPMVVRESPTAAIRGRVGLMYMPEGGLAKGVHVAIGSPHLESGIAGRVRELDAAATVELGGNGAGERTFSIPLDKDALPVPGAHTRTFPLLFAITEESPVLHPRGMAGVCLVRESLDAWREGMEARLAKAEVAHPELGAAVTACRFRLSAVSDRAPMDNTYLLASPLRMDELVNGAESLITKIEQGEDPFVHACGDWWMTLRIGETDLPVRMYRDHKFHKNEFGDPVEEPDHPQPLIIAVHGAGGDENLWMDGYGAGELKRVAIERDAVLVTPRIVPGIFTPAMFDGIVEAVAKWQDIDRSRVYVIGHSLGGGVVTTWAKLRPDTIAAACSIAGAGSLTGSKRIAPMLAYAAELDGLIRPEAIEKSAASARQAGLDVEFREVKNYGHVLAVGKVTREAVDWMMQKRGKPEGEARGGRRK